MICASQEVCGVLTALASGGQTGATLLSGDINRVGTVATTADSCLLPAATFGKILFVTNAGSNSMNVFPQSGESINALTSDAAFAVAANKRCIFWCSVAGKWDALLTA